MVAVIGRCGVDVHDVGGVRASIPDAGIVLGLLIADGDNQVSVC